MDDYVRQMSMNIPKSKNISARFSMKNSTTKDNSMGNNSTVDEKAKTEQKKTDNLSMMNNNQIMLDGNFYENDKINDEKNRIKEFRDEKFLFYYNLFKKEFHNNKNFKNRIYINYCNKEKKEIYLDFNDKMGDICGYILDSIGLCQNNSTEIYKRKERNQTTKNIIENPMIENHFVFYVDEYVFLEYKNKKINISSDINNISDISGIDFGLKDDEEIALKLNEEIIKTRALKEDLSIGFRQGKVITSIICKEDE